MSTVTTATATATATVLAASPQTSVSEAVVFWIVAPVAIAAALAMVFSRHAVHAALLLIVDFFCLAVLYAAQDAPFLAAVQVIVYTGAIMILFLFVLMLVGVDSSDSLVETLRGQRVAAARPCDGICRVALPIAPMSSTTKPRASALLITAALGAMVLAHKEQVVPRVSQREMSRRRFAGEHPTPYPSPGVFARHDAVDTPALLPDGTAAEPRPPVLEGSSNQAGRAGDPAGPGATGSGS